jgi:glucosyl-dolichyl phosphate glucuronosyltransferase
MGTVASPRFSVIVCAYTECRWTALCDAVEAVGTQVPAPHQVIVVVDGNPNLFERARSSFADVLVVQNEQERGLSGARNTGIRHATGDVLVFLDDDARPYPDWLHAMAVAYEDHTIIGVGGSALPDWFVEAPRWLPSEFWWTVGCSYTGMASGAEIRNPIGANMSFRREAFERAGVFQHGIGRIGALPLGCEETELAIRVKRAFPNQKIVLVDESRVAHNVTADRASFKYFVSRCWSEGLSKAAVARLAGSEAALSSERRYVTRVLPTGVVGGLGDALRGDWFGLLRSAAILAGLVITTAGYASGLGRLALRGRGR